MLILFDRDTAYPPFRFTRPSADGKLLNLFIL